MFGVGLELGVFRVFATIKKGKSDSFISPGKAHKPQKSKWLAKRGE